VQTHVQELPENKVRLEVEVPSADLKHALEHAASDLAGSLRIPGFRKGKVPKQVLLARVGRERLYAEAVESHIGGWFWNAAARSRIRPVAAPEYGYDLPATESESFRFSATVSVQPKIEVADWTALEVPAPEAEVPPELIEGELEALRDAVAELSPIEDRPSLAGDVLVVDLEESGGGGQRDLVVEVGAGRLIDEIDEALVGLRAGESKEIPFARPDGSSGSATATVKEIKEKVLPPVDDELAQAASEFSSLGELKASIEERLLEQLEDEIESGFRAATIDSLVDASNVEASGPLVDARVSELARGFVSSLERRGISVENYLALTGGTAEDLQGRLRAEATRSVARELVLEAVADRAAIEVADADVDAFVREQAALSGDDEDEIVAQVRANGRFESLREDLRLRRALDRVASEVKRIPVELARAREKLWTPEQEKRPSDTKLWTPGSEERP